MARSRAERAGLGHKGPADGVVSVLHQPLVLERPDVLRKAGSDTLRGFFEILLVVCMSKLPLRLGDAQVGLVRQLQLNAKLLASEHS